MLKSVIGMYQFLSQSSISQEGVNVLAELEKKFVVTSRSYFRKLQMGMLGTLSLTDYLTRTSSKLAEE
jgi:hypothetical protein